MIQAGERTVWEALDVELYDAGPDGHLPQSPGLLFMEAGVFIP
jgi:hypothetical protein